MTYTKPKFATDACRALERAVTKLAGAVRVTLGPKGQYVVLDQAFGTPTITNDGVTVARQVELEDVFELQRAPSWWWGGHQDQRRCRRPDHDSPRAGPEDR